MAVTPGRPRQDDHGLRHGQDLHSLKIAEAIAGKGKRVLFLVPSLALMSQTVREWTIDTETPLRAFAVCSDAQVGKRRKSNDDIAEIESTIWISRPPLTRQAGAEESGQDDPRPDDGRLSRPTNPFR
jgi:hypothetical protein